MTSYIMPEIILDPIGAFPDVDRLRLKELVGIIPNFIIDTYVENIENPDFTSDEFIKSCEEKYGFGFYESIGGKLEDNGVYQYPEDPPLNPLVSITLPSGKVFMYEHAMTAFAFDDRKPYIVRMD